MARIGRLAGALLVETGDAFYLVGNTKEPCDWPAHGFEPPPEIDALKQPWIPLRLAADAHPQSRQPQVGEPYLQVELEGEPLLAEIARRMLVSRNGSVSERLWRLVLGTDESTQAPKGGLPARWLTEAPEPVWRVVREAVLRCV